MCFGDADKIATKETVKLVEKIIDVKKEEFLKNQKILSEFMNKGYGLILKNDFKCSSMVMGIGSSGCGKSTTLNLMHGNNFVTGKDCGDVTMQLSIPTPSVKYPNTKVIDCVGFTPSLSSFCKLILIYFQRGFFPDYFLYPSSNDRTEQIVTLYRMIRMDYVKIMVVPFSAKNYHSNIELIKEIDPTMSESEVDTKSLKKAFNSDMVSHIIEKLAEIKLKNDETLKGKVIVVESLDKVPEVIGSMKTMFLNEFFIGGKFIDSITYEQFCENSSDDDPQSTKIFLYGLLVDAMKTLSSFAKYDNNGVLIGIEEQKFLKDN
ncbi:hypothetical protein DDB_G0275487 [Dictyostelium discoideum AX4]|uniref:Uncharacterized protein n=1 Tax=Dictyostelium discoideum TaxID=44689 RepID=Q86ID4_DICDI|nr:hypothetical protein DDB_G0275487 [Dictyostelium discoideum AX4]EAL69494.1 hypothetical protein DDB_G0275487 [Dictyostelium discoideum AX4]|eukprot:XP_643586.1 hypothetical protein DDB_G0275487 [Dictyostelium discoideum AX4]